MALPYYYNSQIKKYLMQFQNIFTGLQVSVGATEERGPALIPVPVQYGSRDRVTAALLASNTQNKPLRLPLISTYLTGIQMAPELRKGVGGQRSETYVPRGGVVPDDIKVVKQYMPIPYRLTAEVSIYTSNIEQHFQIIEQLLMLFDPILQIQTDDNVHNWAKITTVELLGIRFEENYPIGTDRRMIVTGLDFDFPVYISAPIDLRSSYVHDIFLRLSTLDYSDPMPQTFEDFEELGGIIENIASVDDIVGP